MADMVRNWLEGYKRAWESRDPDAAAALFTADARYREQPYQEPFDGAAGVRAYWTEVTATQDDVQFRYGTPLVTGNRAVAEWWVTMTNGGADVTLAGIFLLTFDDAGLCSDLVEYWHFSEGQLLPYPNWGS